MKYTEEQIKEFASKQYPGVKSVNNLGRQAGFISGFKKAMELKEQPIKKHGDTICQECGAKNITWYAENELFNSINGDGNGVFCPDCFTEKAENVGINDIIFKAIRANDEQEPATKPLSEITDEDAIEVGRILGLIQPYVDCRLTEYIVVKQDFLHHIVFYFDGDLSSTVPGQGIEIFQTYDFLRSKGYILPTDK